jgi:putative FmdB family regulatory protein
VPTFEYSCDSCEILFEELFVQSDEIEKFKEWHPCPKCQGRATREHISLTNFSFKAPAGQTQGSGVHGQSGIHDLDYPKLDKAIGRSAAVKWNEYHGRKAKRDKVRKDTGTNSISTTPDGKVLPADKSTQILRDKAMGTFTKVKKSYEGK